MLGLCSGWAVSLGSLMRENDEGMDLICEGTWNAIGCDNGRDSASDLERGGSNCHCNGRESLHRS